MDEDLAVRLHRIERQLAADRIALERRIDQVDGRLAEVLILLKRALRPPRLKGRHMASARSDSSRAPATTSRAE